MNEAILSYLPKLVSTAQKAGEAILAIYHDAEKSEVVDHKADDSPLTLADQASHQVIEQALGKLAPEIPVLSEEGKHLAYSERKAWRQFWLVDPLDGTKEFIKRNGEFTVNIALVEGQTVVAGVVYVPVKGVTYFASKGQGAFKQEGNQAPQPITASEFRMTDPGLRLVCSRSHLSAEVEAYLEQFEAPQTVSMGSSLKLVLVASGEADIYPRLGPTMEWDTAAAQIVVEEAGGQVISQETQAPMIYNKENLLNPYFIVFGNKQEG